LHDLRRYLHGIVNQLTQRDTAELRLTDSSTGGTLLLTLQLLNLLLLGNQKHHQQLRSDASEVVWST
jgi:hypothetical protein